MKKLFFTIAIAVLGFTASYAQQAQRPERVKLSAEERAEKTASALETKLSLTADQKAKIKQLELDRIKQRDEYRKQDSEKMRGNLEVRKAAMKIHQERIDAVLTPEQKEKLTAARAEMKTKIKERTKDRKGRYHRTPKAQEPSASKG